MIIQYSNARACSDEGSCQTCNLSYFQCPGHFGHIELAIPVFQPLFMQQVYGLFRGVCLFCHKYRMPEMMVSHRPLVIRVHRS